MTQKGRSNDIATDDPLVSTEWLAAHLDDPQACKIIDASFKLPGVLPLPIDDYLAAHIPGAVFFDVDAVSDHPIPLPHMYPDAAQFARDVGALGISSGDTVVAYDAGGWVAAPRAWWMFLSFGHPNVKVLDGGLKKWRAEGRPTQSGKVTPKPGKFTATLDPRLCAQQAAAGEQSRDAAPSSWSMRAPQPRFEGTRRRSRGRAAAPAISPAAATCPMPSCSTPTTGAMKPLENCAQAFRGAGVDLTKPIVTSCGSGVSALVLTLALYRLACAAARSMTAHGPNGACPTARRSRPGPPERSSGRIVVV